VVASWDPQYLFPVLTSAYFPVWSPKSQLAEQEGHGPVRAGPEEATKMV